MTLLENEATQGECVMRSLQAYDSRRAAMGNRGRLPVEWKVDLTEGWTPSMPKPLLPIAALLLFTLMAMMACTGATPTPNHTETPPTTLVITVAPIQPGIPGYDRDDWKHWTDADGDCQDARQEVLVEESLDEVTFETDRGCRVATGRWYGAFTGVSTQATPGTWTSTTWCL